MAVPLRHFLAEPRTGEVVLAALDGRALSALPVRGEGESRGGRRALYHPVSRETPVSHHLGLLGDAWRLLARGHGNLEEPCPIGAVTRPPGEVGLRHDRVDGHPARVIAAAAALSGLAKNVRDLGPCLPSKFLFEVETAYLPAGILSSFIARHEEQPGCLSSNPAFLNISSKPSFFTCSSTIFEPGTRSAVIPAAFFLPFTMLAKALKSSILPLVQLPRKT